MASSASSLTASSPTGVTPSESDDDSLAYEEAVERIMMPTLLTPRSSISNTGGGRRLSQASLRFFQVILVAKIVSFSFGHMICSHFIYIITGRNLHAQSINCSHYRLLATQPPHTNLDA